MNFKFRLNSKRKPFSSRNNPSLKLRWRRIRAFLFPSGKTQSWKTISGVLMLRCCRSWARHTLCAQDEPCKQPPAKWHGHKSGSVIPNKCPHEVGRRAHIHASAAGLCSWIWLHTCGARSQHGLCLRDPQHHSPGYLPMPHLSPSRGFASPLTRPPTKYMVIFNWHFICCSAFLKPKWCFLAKSWFSS